MKVDYAFRVENGTFLEEEKNSVFLWLPPYPLQPILTLEINMNLRLYLSHIELWQNTDLRLQNIFERLKDMARLLDD